MEKSKENPRFLKEKYKLGEDNLNISKEVESAAFRTEKRNKKINLHENSQEGVEQRIQNYLNRLEDIFENPNKDAREQGIKFVKNKLYEQFVIKPDQIPEAYFKSKYREEGYGGNEVPDSYRRKLAEIVVSDQICSLDNWIDYFSSDGAEYPGWLKYFAIRSTLRMGRFDKTKKSFTERTNTTTAPFPELNREALVLVFESFKQQAKGEPPKFGYDISESLQAQFIEFLEKKNFAKLYALAIEEFKPIPDELLQITEGEWRTYPRGSDPKPLVESISFYGTGWCLRGESMARHYLVDEDNELQVYYSLDKEGNPTVPRVAIVVDMENQLREVRGVASEENLDQYINPVVSEKLEEFPYRATYKKKLSDMNFLAELKSKLKQNQLFTRNDLLFLYEINSPIEGFGYQTDRRIAELRKSRNLEEDLLVVFECTKEQIAHTPSQIKKDTKVYVGKLEPGIFQKLPDTLKYIYTSFPNRRIRRESIEIGGKTGEQLITEMEVANINISGFARDLIENPNFVPSKNKEVVTLISLTIGDLFGFERIATYDQLYERKQMLGLEWCPLDTGPYVLKYKDQLINDFITIGTKPIDIDGLPLVLGIQRLDSGFSLEGCMASPGAEVNPNLKIVFCFRKSETV